MTTTDLTQEPPGPVPASARSAEFDNAEGGGGSLAPASGRTEPARQPSAPPSLKWAPWAVRSAAGVLAVLALAGIGTASLARGGDGVRLREASSLLSDDTDRWLSALAPPSPATPSHPRARKGPAGTQAEDATSGSNAGTAAKTAASSSNQAPDAGDPGGGITPDGKVVLNLADAEQLTRLPSVGPKRAKAILQLRSRLKRFRRATDLLRVRGIGPKTLRRMLPHLVVDPPVAPAAANDAAADSGKS